MHETTSDVCKLYQKQCCELAQNLMLFFQAYLGRSLNPAKSHNRS
jgi:hypothetical protein